MRRRQHPRSATAAARVDAQAFGRMAIHMLLLLAVACALGCSGSGSGSDSPTSPQILDAASVESQSFQLINQARSDEGVSSLVFDNELSRIAREHSEAMRDQGFFSHRDPNGNGLRSRLRAGGVSFSAAGENLAVVSDTGNPAGVAHQQLLTSPEHRDVMLTKKFDQAGVGVARSGGRYWITQVYLKR